MAFGWDVDDDVFDGDEDDNEHPFGDDEDLNYDDSQEQADAKESGQQGPSSKPERKNTEQQQKEQSELQEKQTEQMKKQEENAPDSPKMMKRVAKAEGMPDKIEKYPCPKCKKFSLFQDKVVPKGIRLAVLIARACVGAAQVKEITSVPHYRCMNPKCKAYWKRTGTYFERQPTGGMKEVKSIFHIDRS